jgi:hypothetical protein
LRPSRFVAGIIAGTSGAVFLLAVFVREGDELLRQGGEWPWMILKIGFGVALGLLWFADHLGLLADPHTKATSVYEKKPKGDNRQSV